MLLEIRKLQLIEEVIKVNNEHTLSALEAILNESPQKKENLESQLSEFAGIWSKDEAQEIEYAILESCKQINPNDWK